MKADKEHILKKNGFICDMDGVIYHGNRLLDGTLEYIKWLKENKKQFLFLTNNSALTQKDLQQKLDRLGVKLDEKHFYTSALATAQFLNRQHPRGSAFVIGEAGLTNALYDIGFSMNDINPDYVVVGESRAYSYEKIEHAVRLVLQGAKLIGTNTDITGPTEKGIVPACRALISPIELATNTQAYFIGKPNPLIMRHALKEIGCQREETVIIGDRMDTDIIAGVESEIDTVLVLSGVTSKDELQKFPYQPKYVFENIAAIFK